MFRKTVKENSWEDLQLRHKQNKAKYKVNEKVKQLFTSA